MPPWLREHSRSVAFIAVRLARRTRLDIRRAALAAYVHDIGKQVIALQFWQAPRPLTEFERLVVKAHPAVGAVHLAESGITDPVILRAVMEHHERVDGSGYPYGKVGAELSPLGKLLAVADAYVALREARPWRAGMPPDVALRLLREGRAGGALDPFWLEVLEQVVGEEQAGHASAAGL